MLWDGITLTQGSYFHLVYFFEPCLYENMNFSVTAALGIDIV